MIKFRAVTLRDAVRMEGRGIHLGGHTRVVIHPGSNGLRLRSDGKWIAITPEQVTSTQRCTAVAGIRTVEHLLSALGGTGVTDADIEVTGSEIPILDGSSAPWCEAIHSVGTLELDLERTYEIADQVTLSEPSSSVHVRAGDGVFRAIYERYPFPGRLEFTHCWDPKSYEREVAPARTFAWVDEIEQMRAVGLGLGGSEENTLVLGPRGYLTPCRFDDEPARHKVLDCMGDLMLCGIPLRFLAATAERSGHRLHVEAAKALSSATRRLE